MSSSEPAYKHVSIRSPLRGSPVPSDSARYSAG